LFNGSSAPFLAPDEFLEQKWRMRRRGISVAARLPTMKRSSGQLMAGRFLKKELLTLRSK